MESRDPRLGPRLVVFSGGTALNSIVRDLSVRLTVRVTHVLPISDNGGSSKEIIRFLGGPAIGDIRSRLIRLADTDSIEHQVMRRVLEHRLTKLDRSSAKVEMMSLVDGSHPIWSHNGETECATEVYLVTLRAFLVHFVEACERRAATMHAQYSHHVSTSQSPTPRPSSSQDCREKAAPAQSAPSTSPSTSSIFNFSTSMSPAVVATISTTTSTTTSTSASASGSSVTRPLDSSRLDNKLNWEFDYRGGSVGNFVFTGARLFFNSLDAAIFWFTNLSGIPRDSHVVPISSLNRQVTLAARLMDGSVVVGQNNISHPAVADIASSAVSEVDKSEAGMVPLASPITRVFYVDEFCRECSLPVNPKVLRAISTADALVYSIGSLYTSILPSLVVPGVGDAIASFTGPKILLLNSCQDRETWGMGVADFVQAIESALLESLTTQSSPSDLEKQGWPGGLRFLTHVVYGDPSLCEPEELEQADHKPDMMAPKQQIERLQDNGIKLYPIPLVCVTTQGHRTQWLLKKEELVDTIGFIVQSMD